VNVGAWKKEEVDGADGGFSENQSVEDLGSEGARSGGSHLRMASSAVHAHMVVTSRSQVVE
jgi:hypothetical protein